MEIAKSKAPREVLNWDDIQNIRYSWNVACEVMRFASVQGLSGKLLPTSPSMASPFQRAGSCTGVQTLHTRIQTTSLNLRSSKNPDYFPEPQKFDPSRFEGRGPASYTYVPFGGGPRMCPAWKRVCPFGNTCFHAPVQRFKWDKLIPDEKIVVDPMPIPAKGLPVRLFPHKT